MCAPDYARADSVCNPCFSYYLICTRARPRTHTIIVYLCCSVSQRLFRQIRVYTCCIRVCVRPRDFKVHTWELACRALLSTFAYSTLLRAQIRFKPHSRLQCVTPRAVYHTRHSMPTPFSMLFAWLCLFSCTNMQSQMCVFFQFHRFFHSNFVSLDITAMISFLKKGPHFLKYLSISLNAFAIAPRIISGFWAQRGKLQIGYPSRLKS